MAENFPEGLGAYAASPMTPKRRKRQRDAIDRKLDGVARRRQRARRALAYSFAAALGAAAAGAVALVLMPSAGPAPSREGAEVAAGAMAMHLSLSDGSSLTLSPGARVHVVRDQADGQLVEIDSGSVTFAVARDVERPFAVRAADVTVRVVGTRFRVSLLEEAGEVDVEVFEGIVHVESALGAEARRLEAGERCVVAIGRRPQRASLEPLETDPSAAEREAQAVGGPGTEDSPTPRTEGSPTDGSRALRDRTPSPAQSADDLFESATRARREGDAEGAASAFGRFVRERARDPRAGVAAFELGKLRLEQLGDPRGAVAAFRRAAARRGPHQEDARARVVEAHERAGDIAGCRDAQREYLRRHPTGVHVQMVQSRCR